MARELYQAALDGGSNEETTVDGLFYALIEEENFDEAYDLVGRLKSKEPPWRHYSGTPSPIENGRRLDLDMMGVNARYYGNQLNKAWLGIDRLNRAAPGNRWVLETHARIALARSWRHRALEEFKLAATLNSDSTAALAGEAESRLQLSEYKKAESRLGEGDTSEPESP